MCAVSVVYDYFRDRPNIPWTRTEFEEFKDIVRRLETLDYKLQQPDCEDPSKTDWMTDVEARLSALEQQ